MLQVGTLNWAATEAERKSKDTSGAATGRTRTAIPYPIALWVPVVILVKRGTSLPFIVLKKLIGGAPCDNNFLTVAEPCWGITRSGPCALTFSMHSVRQRTDSR